MARAARTANRKRAKAVKKAAKTVLKDMRKDSRARVRKGYNSVEVGSAPRIGSPLRVRADAWENVITGLGTRNRDKRLGAEISVPRSVDNFQFFEDLYHGDDIARTIVDTVASDLVREWITITTDDSAPGAARPDAKGSDASITQLQSAGGKNSAAALKMPPPLNPVGKKIRGDAGEPPPPPDPNAPADPNKEPLTPKGGPDLSASEAASASEDADGKMLVGKATMQKLEALEAQTKFYECEVWSQVFGGALLFMGIDDGGGKNPNSMAQPLNEDNIKSFTFLAVFDRWDVDVQEWYRDPKEEKFGMPMIYRIRQNTTAGGSADNLAGNLVHESRVIRFDGAMVNRRRRLRNAGWADSIYIRLSDVIRDFATSWGGVANLLQDFSQAVFKMKGLAEALLEDEDDVILDRMTLMDLSRSVARAIPIDAEDEDFSRTQTPVSGMAELLDRFALRLAAAARMPVTLLMGQSPAGLNATGEGDIRNYYDSIKASQERRVRPRLNRLLSLLFKAKDGPTKGVVPKSWSFTFNPLWQLSDAERATARKSVADTDVAYITAGVLHPEEVAASRFGGDRYSMDTVLDQKLRAQQAAQEEKLKSALHDAYNAQPEPVDGSPKPMLEPPPSPEEKAKADLLAKGGGKPPFPPKK